MTANLFLKNSDNEILLYIQYNSSIENKALELLEIAEKIGVFLLDIKDTIEKLKNEGVFDLVFTMGVLIHINPDQLIENMAKIFKYSSRYILFGEYFNRTPVSIEYQGEQNKLFKRDFGRLFINNFDVNLIDYGFLWSYIYQVAGFDDITWWLFEK